MVIGFFIYSAVTVDRGSGGLVLRRACTSILTDLSTPINCKTRASMHLDLTGRLRPIDSLLGLLTCICYGIRYLRPGPAECTSDIVHPNPNDVICPFFAGEFVVVSKLINICLAKLSTDKLKTAVLHYFHFFKN